MKKLLVLMLVLGLTSAAGALTVRLSTDGINPADELEAVPGGSYTFYVISDTAGSAGAYWTYLEMYLPSPGTIDFDDAFILPNAGDLSSKTDYSTPELLDIELFVCDSAGNIGAGVQFTFYLDIASDWDLTPFDIWITTPNDANWPVEHTLSIVPEPMTIALLGLGSLFLRRRKHL
jgi:hypothetical protein